MWKRKSGRNLCLEATRAAMPQQLGTKTKRVMYKGYQFQVGVGECRMELW
jgi:hypothetical protein